MKIISFSAFGRYLHLSIVVILFMQLLTRWNF